MMFLPFLAMFFGMAEQTDYIRVDIDSWHMTNPHMDVQISKESGCITQIVIRSNTVLSYPCSFGVANNMDLAAAETIDITTKDCHPQFGELLIIKASKHYLYEIRYRIDSVALYCEVATKSTLNQNEETSTYFNIPVVKSMQYLFFPDKQMPMTLDSIDSKIVTYRKNIALPIITLYNRTKNYGLSAIVDPSTPTPSLLFEIDTQSLEIQYDHQRLSNTSVARAAVYLVPHEGDWRRGLDYMLQILPTYFNSFIDNAKMDEAWFSQSRPSDTPSRIEDIAEKNVAWVEFLYYFPFFGLFTPKSTQWALISNSEAVTLSEWEAGRGTPKYSHDKMHRLIDKWHEQGVHVYLYFQAFEAWHQYADKYFRNDIARDESHNPLPAWKFTNLMNPDPASEWGEHVLSQATDVIEKYPQIDGIFYDRMDYWNYDFAHDDGITMIDDEPAYMLSFAGEKINNRVFNIFHQANKAICGNTPTSIEVCKNLDGILAEGNLRNLQRLQYLSIARPLIYLPYDRTPQETESKLKNSLVCGAFPAITHGGSVCQQLDNKYNPLFAVLRKRKWILTHDPIKLPKNLTGNVFMAPDSSYVITLVNLQKSQLTPHPFEYSIPLAITIPTAHEINYAYLLSGDWMGVNAIDFTKEDSIIIINVPYHLASSVVLLSKQKKFDMVRLSSPVVLSGKETTMLFHVDHTANRNAASFKMTAPWMTEKITCFGDTLATVSYIPTDVSGEIEFTIRHEDKKYTMSCWVVDPVSLTPIEKLFVKFKEGENVPFYITNNLNKAFTVQLQGQFRNGNGELSLVEEIMLMPFESRIIQIGLKVTKEDTVQLIMDFEDQRIKKEFPVKHGLFAEETDLFYDNFKNDMNKWTHIEGDWSVSDGIATGSGESHLAVKEGNWSNVMFEVRTRCKGSQSPAVDWLKSYVFFRMQDERNFYRFGIHGGLDMLTLYKKAHGQWHELSRTSFVAERNRWYALRVRAHGDTISCYLDGEIVIEARDATFTSGGIGIGVTEDRMITEYEDITLKDL